MKYLFLSFLAISLSFSSAHAQIRNVPTEVKNAIKAQFPNAKNVDYTDHLAVYEVTFSNNDSLNTVVITNGGKIKNREVAIKFENLPSEVKDGLKKSKYADWKINSASKYYEPGSAMQYKLNASGESILSKKNLYFSPAGQLLSDKRAL